MSHDRANPTRNNLHKEKRHRDSYITLVPWLSKLDAAIFCWNQWKERMKNAELNLVLLSELQEDQNEDQCFSPASFSLPVQILGSHKEVIVSASIPM